MKTSHLVIILAAFAAVALIVYLEWDTISAALGIQTAKASTGTGTPTITGTGTSTANCTYPVTVKSPAACIYQAFTDSGYLAAVTASCNAGTYPASYLTAMKNDPSTWLANHPYLYSAYSQYFASAS